MLGPGAKRVAQVYLIFKYSEGSLTCMGPVHVPTEELQYNSKRIEDGR